MKLALVPESLEIEIDGLKLQFVAASEQDIVFAAAIIDNRDVAKTKPGSLDRDTAVKHVFSKLISFSGEVQIGGESISVERFKEIAMSGRLQASFSIPVTLNWAVEVLKSHGLFGSEADEKKA